MTDNLKINASIQLVSGSSYSQVLTETPLRPFSDCVYNFLDALSKSILKSREFRFFPEIMAFGYWIRRAHLKVMSKDLDITPVNGVLCARGTAFHIAPANVDTIFLYSFVLSVLAGNKNIVRISSRDSEQVTAVLNAITQLLQDKQYDEVKSRLSIIRYDRSEEITAHLSRNCDVRVLWGGNVSVNAIRKLPISPYAIEMCFPDKVSLAVIDSKFYLNATKEERAQLAKNFVNDSFVFGQMACSSPHLIVWRGSQKKFLEANELFWETIDEFLLKITPELTPVEFVNKLVNEQALATKVPLKIRQQKTNHLNVNTLENVSDFDRDNYCGGGFFSQVHLKNLTELNSIIGRNIQTVTSFGIPQRDWKIFLTEAVPTGIDRIVAPGEALKFSPVWDGLNLLKSFMRETTVSA